MQKEKGSTLLISVFIGLLIASGLLGAYYLGLRQSDKISFIKQETNKTIQPLSPTSSSNVSSSVPSNWVIKKSELCNVSIPVPPKEIPYITEGNNPEDFDSGAFWQYEENPQYSTDMFARSTLVTYRNPEGFGSGYIAGWVFISCSPNQSYTTNSLMVAYEKKFIDGVYQGFEIKSKKLVNKWGLEVWEVLHSGGMFSDTSPTYYFATSTHIYSVSRVSMSKNQFVKETTEKIFNNLEF